MKKIFNILLATFALFVFVPVANALDDDPPYIEQNHIAYSKYPTGPVNGIYTIHLDTFVTGEVTVSTSNLPADIVLVLDVSGSMDEDYTTTHYEYTARASQGYSYDNYSNNTYYYLYNNNYYPVSRGSATVNIGSWWNPNNVTVYYLYIQVPGNWGRTTTYYLSGTNLEGNQPNNIRNTSDVIWTGVLYERSEIIGQSKLEALQGAVAEFIDAIKDNAEEKNVDNQIAIVKFAMDEYAPSQTPGKTAEQDLAEGDDSYYYNQRVPNANYTQVVKQFTNVKENAQALKNAVNGLHAAGATAADYGMKKAQLLLEDLIENDPDRESNKTVVLFTDGAPTYGSEFNSTVASNTIANAYVIKGIKAYEDPEDGDVFTSVFTVGIFDSETTNIRDYMNYTSSNYPDAQNWTTTGTGSDQGYYMLVSDETDLSSIFRSIASQSGGSEATQVTAEAATTVDVISQSFDLPNGADTNIGVFFAQCTGVDDEGYLTFDTDHLIENPAEGQPGHVTIEIDETNNKVTASGFDYSGYWCGKDESLGENVYRGRKLMLLIPIEMADDAVGGNAVETNGPDSGIYVDGNPVIKFEVPHIDLPTNLHIKKEGIADGECATFEIYRKLLNPSTSKWETTPFKTVIVIGGNNDNTVKLMGLDPHYLYKIVEAGWSWSYDFDKVTDSDGTKISSENEVTSDLLVSNPFIFVDKKKATQIRHAESAVYNDFSTAGKVVGVDAVGQNKKEAETGDEGSGSSKSR